MSEAQFKRDFDASFFDAWSGAMGGIDAVYTSVAAVDTPVQVLVDTNVEQFGDDPSAVSYFSTHISFRRAQVEPETGATVVVDGATYTLVQRVPNSDESLSRWVVQR